MKTLEYYIVDKSEWSDGPWKTEPDKRQWLDETTGYPCVIERNSAGALAGYVGVPPGHPAYKKHHEMVDLDVTVHGGLTFADKRCSQPGGICHEIEPGDIEDVYWLGFNCAHLGDRSPRLEMHIVAPLAIVAAPGTYRDINFVTQECRRLAVQLKDLEGQSRVAQCTS